MINSLFRRFIKILDLNCSSYLCPGVPTSRNYITTEIHLNHYKDSPCVFNFSCFYHHFVYRSSSWMFYMMVHRGFISFSKRSSTFFSVEFKHSSSCNPEFNSFYRIIWGGIMSFLMISLCGSWFTCCQDWDILNPSSSSWELSWVIFHLKPSLRIVAIYGAHKWSKLFFILPVKYFLVSLFK